MEQETVRVGNDMPGKVSQVGFKPGLPARGLVLQYFDLKMDMNLHSSCMKFAHNCSIRAQVLTCKFWCQLVLALLMLAATWQNNLALFTCRVLTFGRAKLWLLSCGVNFCCDEEDISQFLTSLKWPASLRSFFLEICPEQMFTFFSYCTKQKVHVRHLDSPVLWIFESKKKTKKQGAFHWLHL